MFTGIDKKSKTSLSPRYVVCALCTKHGIVYLKMHIGIINWTHFEAVEAGRVIALTDKSKSSENAASIT